MSQENKPTPAVRKATPENLAARKQHEEQAQSGTAPVARRRKVAPGERTRGIAPEILEHLRQNPGWEDITFSKETRENQLVKPTDVGTLNGTPVRILFHNKDGYLSDAPWHITQALAALFHPFDNRDKDSWETYHALSAAKLVANAVGSITYPEKVQTALPLPQLLRGKTFAMMETGECELIGENANQKTLPVRQNVSSLALVQALGIVDARGDDMPAALLALRAHHLYPACRVKKDTEPFEPTLVQTFYAQNGAKWLAEVVMYKGATKLLPPADIVLHTPTHSVAVWRDVSNPNATVPTLLLDATPHVSSALSGFTASDLLTLLAGHYDTDLDAYDDKGQRFVLMNSEVGYDRIMGARAPLLETAEVVVCGTLIRDLFPGEGDVYYLTVETRK